MTTAIDTDAVIEQLEKQFSDPETDTKSEEEWIEVCDTFLFHWADPLNENKRCGDPAVVNITLVCPFCGPRTKGKCQAHFTMALQGRLVCTDCSKKANTGIQLKPINAVWKSE